jgi:hypothetical protein
MFTPQQYRSKADEYTELAKTANNDHDLLRLRKLERSFVQMADNEQWLADNHDKMVHAAAPRNKSDATLAAEEEYVLRCLGAALIMQWNTLPTKLRRELFDGAGSMGKILDVGVLRAQIARFLHKHKDDDGAVGVDLADMKTVSDQ